MEMMSIGDFARETRLSQKALRLYDELGLLPPARVDPVSGYRLYEPAQLEKARLVAMLRQIGMPLSDIKVTVGLDAPAAALRLERYWSGVDQDHAARRALAGYLVDRLIGKRVDIYEVATRKMPERSLLCLKRRVDEEGAWALGKEFVGIFTARPLPRPDGVSEAAFCIYHGEVSQDSDGPVEWCKPVPAEKAAELANAYPELELRTEAAHEEAFVDIGPGGKLEAAQWLLVSEALRSWGEESGRLPSVLGARVIFRAMTPVGAEPIGPDCDFAIPLR